MLPTALNALRLAALTILLVTIQAIAAGAHASLNASQPLDGAIVGEPPQSLSLSFSEPVAPLSLKLIKPDGSSVTLEGFDLKDRTLRIETPDGLDRGTHVLSWRVVSADGHPIGGSVIFSIGEASAQAPTAAEEIDWTVRGGLWLSKTALYLGLFVGIGGVFARHVYMPGIASGGRTIATALVVGAVGAILSAGFQGLDALGEPVAHLVEPVIWQTGLGTTYGLTIGVALAAFVLAALAQKAGRSFAQALGILALIAAAASLALSGHASAASPQWLMRPMVFLHGLAVAMWIGALAPLGQALKRNEPGAATALRRFSAVIPAVVAALIVTGIALAFVQVEYPSALFNTAYGNVFLVKLALLVGLFGLACVNRWRLTRPAETGDPPATRRLARSIALETGIAIAIFGAVAMWRFTPPPRVLAEMAARPEFVHIHSAKAMADVTVTPGRAGQVSVSIAIMTGDFAPLDPKEVALVLANPQAGIEPLTRQASKSADGRWRIDGLILPLAGVWDLRVDVLISNFDMVRLDSQIQIRP